MIYHVLDTVVLARDVHENGLRKGDLGAVVEVYEPDGLEVEFVTASGRSAALLTLNGRGDSAKLGGIDCSRPATCAAGRHPAANPARLGDELLKSLRETLRGAPPLKRGEIHTVPGRDPRSNRQALPITQ